MLLNLLRWRHWDHERHLARPALLVLAELQNFLHQQINLLEILADDGLPAAAWSPARLSPVWRRWIEQIGEWSGCHRTWPSEHNTGWWFRVWSAAWPVHWQSSSSDTRLDQYIPLMTLRACDLMTYTSEVRALLRGSIVGQKRMIHLLSSSVQKT